MIDGKDLKNIKKVIRYIKLARRLDSVGFHAMIDSESFMKEFVRPLEESCGWNEEDQKEVERIAIEFKKEAAKSKTLQEKNSVLRNIVKLGAFGLFAGAGVAGVAHLLKTKEEEKK